MVRRPDATMQPAPQDNQLMSKHRVLSFKPQLRLEWRGQDGQNETEQPDHSASLGDSITSSIRIWFSVHTGTLPLAIFGPENYGYRLGLLGAPSRMAQAAAPLAFSFLIDVMGGRVLIVSSALSLSALFALCLL